MFPTGKRFTGPRTPSQLVWSVKECVFKEWWIEPEHTPSPGSYDVKSSLLSNDPTKHFGFIEKSKRFRSPKAGEVGIVGEASEEGGKPEVKPRVVSSSRKEESIEIIKWRREADKYKEQFERSQLVSQKNLALLEEKLARSDAQYQSMLKEKAGLQAAVTTKERELNAIKQQYVTAKANLEKVEKASASAHEKSAKHQQMQKKVDEAERIVSTIKTQLDAFTTTFALEKKALPLQVPVLEASWKQMVRQRDQAVQALSEKEQQLKSFESEVASLKQAVSVEKSATETATAELHAQITALTETVSQESSARIEAQQELATIKAQMESLLTRQSEESLDRERRIAEMQASLSTLEQQLLLRDGSIKDVTAALKDAQAANKDLETSMENMVAQHAQNEATMLSNHQQVTDMLKQELVMLQEQLQHREQDLSASKASLDQEHATTVALGTQVASLTEQMNALQREIEARNAQLSDSDAAYTQRIASLQAQLEQTESERNTAIQAAEKQADTFAAEKADVESKVKTLHLCISNLEDTEAERRAEIDALQTLLGTSEAEVTDLKSALAGMEASQQDLTGQLHNVTDEAAGLRQLVERLTGHLDSEREAESLTRAILDKKLDRALSDVQALEEAAAATQAEMAAMQVSHRETLMTLQNEIEGYQSELAALHQRTDYAEKVMEQYMRESADKDRTIDQLEVHLSQVSESLEALQVTSDRALAQQRTELNEVKSQLQETQNQLDRTASELQTEQSSRTHWQSAHGDLQVVLDSERSDRKLEVEGLQSQVASLQAECDGHVATLSDLQGQLDMAAVAKQELEKEMERQQTSHAASVAKLMEEHAVAVTELEASISALQRDLATQDDDYTQAMGKMQRQMDEQARIITELTSAQQSQQAEMDSLRSQLDSAENEFAARAEAAEGQASALQETLDSERSQTQQLIVDLNGQIDAQRRALTDKDDALDKAKAHLALVQVKHANEIGTREVSLRTMKEEVHQLQSKLMQKDQEMSVLVTFKETFASREASLVEEKTRLEALVDEARAHMQTYQLEAQSLREVLDETERKNTDIMERFEYQMDYIAKKYKLAESETKKLQEMNVDLLGHSNVKQKIKHIARIKEENLSLKNANITLEGQFKRAKQKVMDLERELEAIRAVKAVGDTSLKKVSRVGRAALAARNLPDPPVLVPTPAPARKQDIAVEFYLPPVKHVENKEN